MPLTPFGLFAGVVTNFPVARFGFLDSLGVDHCSRRVGFLPTVCESYVATHRAFAATHPSFSSAGTDRKWSSSSGSRLAACVPIEFRQRQPVRLRYRIASTTLLRWSDRQRSRIDHFGSRLRIICHCGSVRLVEYLRRFGSMSRMHSHSLRPSPAYTWVGCVHVAKVISKSKSNGMIPPI